MQFLPGKKYYQAKIHFYARLVSSPLLLFVSLQLRHILTGWVPQITFTKDKAHSWLNFR